MPFIITKKTNIDRLIEKHPKLAKILQQKYGLHCIGCFAASFDTLEQGAKLHGMNDKEIDEMVRQLNQTVKKF